jgi:hypothetical protein
MTDTALILGIEFAIFVVLLRFVFGWARAIAIAIPLTVISPAVLIWAHLIAFCGLSCNFGAY